jgi:hypothetical protein
MAKNGKLPVRVAYESRPVSPRLIEYYATEEEANHMAVYCGFTNDEPAGRAPKFDRVVDGLRQFAVAVA